MFQKCILRSKSKKTLQQNKTDLILLRCICSIFLLEKLDLLQCLMGGPRIASYILRSAAIFYCVWIKNAASGP